MQDRLGAEGARPQKEPVYAPIFVAASLTGLYSQRHVFHDPSNVVTQRFYGGRPDTLFSGINVEVSNDLTIVRRPALHQLTGIYPNTPNSMFQWFDDSGVLHTLVDTSVGVYVENLDLSAPTLLFSKNTTQQGFFVASGNTVYYGDGVDLIKHTPWNVNGPVWNWGIAAPTAPPTVTPVASGSAAVAWAAATVFSTMGFVVDGNGNVQQLYGVNANPASPNATQIGTSGNGAPVFSTAYGTTTTDGSVTWTSQGAVALWAPNTLFQPGNAIFDPATGCIFIASHSFPITTGSKRPNFSATLGLSGARVSEPSGGGKWENIGRATIEPTAVLQWAKNTAFNVYPMPLVDPSHQDSAIVFPLIPFLSATGQLCGGQPTYLLGASVAGTTANTGYTPWTGISSQTIGQITLDNQLSWICLGPAAWAANAGYTGWVYGNATFSVIQDGASNMQVCIGSGTSAVLSPGSTATLTAASNASGGNTTYTGTFSTPFPAGFPAKITGFSTGGNNATGLVISCNATTLVIVNPNGVAETHAGTATFNPWGTVYGAQTTDGTATWVCVGAPVAWAANTKWFLPSVGFAPPLASQAYGGAEVVGSAYVQAVTTSGLSGGSAPSWSTTIGDTTTDNTITWTTAAAVSTQSLAWTKGHVYAYSFKCRTPTDDYVTTSLLTFANLNPAGSLAALGNVPGLTAALGPYLGGGTGAVSTSSPVATIAGSNAGAVNTVQGLGSPDPQVDTVIIWRDADGGGSDFMFELIEIPAPSPIAGVPQPWTFKDFLPDVPGTIGGINFPGLDVLSPAPINNQNNPPPAGFIPYCSKLRFSRIWGAQGLTVFFSGGPDVIVGNPDEAFDPTDDFPFKSPVLACISTAAGLICPTATDFECIYGGPSTSSFYPDTMIHGIGLGGPNAWDQKGGEVFFVATDGQFWGLSPSLQLSRLGFPVANTLPVSVPFNSYVAVYENGTDNGVFIGSSQGAGEWMRLNPHQVGADIGGENAMVWSCLGNAVTGGGTSSMITSILFPVTVSGKTTYVERLAFGWDGSGPIRYRNILSHEDYTGSGFQGYNANFEIGAITLVFPGQHAAVKFVELDFSSPAGASQPAVSYVLDDPTISPFAPAWVSLANHVFDPPLKYAGTAITPPYWPNRYYLNQTQDVAIGRRIRLMVAWAATNTKDELISFCVWGRKYVEE